MKQILLVTLILCLSCYTQTFVEIARIGGKGTNPGSFNTPRSLSFAPDGTLYIADAGNNRIQLFDKRGNFIRSVGGFGFGYDQFDHPYDIWTRSVLNIYVADYENRRVIRYDKNMNFLSVLESSEGSPPEFRFLEVASVAVNSQNELFLLDHGENKIIKYDRNGNAERVFGAYESGHGELIEPQQFEIQGFDKLLITDSGKPSVVVYDFFGNFIREISWGGFKKPTGIAVDNQLRIYISDPSAGAVFQISSTLDKVMRLNMKLDKPLQAPMDVACRKESDDTDKSLWLYILDGDELIIGKLTDE
jgi:tripartite motif-containing protein 71